VIPTPALPSSSPDTLEVPAARGSENAVPADPTGPTSQSIIQAPALPLTSPDPPASSSTAQIIVGMLNSKAMFSMFDYHGITASGHLLYNRYDPINDPKSTDDLTFFDLKSRKTTQSFLPAGNRFSISPDGKLVAGYTMSLDNEIEVMTADTRLFKRAFNEYVQSSTFSPDSEHLAVVCLYSIHLINITTRKVVMSVKTSHELGSSCFSADGKTLVVGEEESPNVILLDVRSEKMSRIKFPDKRLGKIWRVAGSDKICLSGEDHFYHLDISLKQLTSFIDHRTYPMDLSQSGRYAGVQTSGEITIFDMVSGSPVFSKNSSGLRLGIVLDDGAFIIENEAAKTYEAHLWK